MTAGATVGSLAGCLGVGEGEEIATADPLGSPIDSSAVSWDDLGDLEGELTVYSGRTSDQISPVFDALRDRYDDLDLEVEYNDNDTHVNQLIQEGDATPADLLYSQDPGALAVLAGEDLTQELPEDVVDAVPERYRDSDGHWTGVTGRVRAVLYNTERWDDDLPDDIFEYATDDRFEGIISTRPNSGTFRAFIMAMVDRKGETETREWIRGMLDDQNVDLFSGGSDQAEAVERGGSDDPIVALGNQYYAARLIDRDPGSPIDVAFTTDDAGCLFNVAGVAPTTAVTDAELTAEFIRHLLSAEGQEYMMEANGEYPVVEDIGYVGDLPSLEEIDPPEFDLSDLDMDIADANNLLSEEGMTV